MSISENLYNLGALLKTNLETKGINGLTGNEGLTTLANKILDIEGSDSSSKSVFAYVTGNSITLGMDGVRWLNSTGDVVINWGDGTSDTVNNPSMSLSHTYANANGHLIAFNGNIKSFGNTCFYKCSGLTSIIIPNKVVSLGNQCFRDCSSLTSVVIPDSVISLGQWCFYKCSGLTSIIIPNSVTYLGTDCFRNCTSLVDYQLYWETQPIQYDSQKMPVNTNTVFTIPYGTTSIYVDAGYPLDKLVERTGAPTDLTLTGDKSIIEKTETAVITALLEDNGLPVYNQSLSYSVKCDSIVLDSGTLTTDVNGQATINYTGTGIGDVSVDISYGSLLQETYIVEDCWKYDPNTYTRNTVSNKNTLISFYDDYNFLSDNFSLEFTFQSSNEGCGFAIAPPNITTPYHHIEFGIGVGIVSVYIGDQNGGETAYRYSTASYNTDYTFKIEYDNGTIKSYVNNVLKDTITGKSYLNGETRELYWVEWIRNVSFKVKDIKIKTLNSINLTSTQNIVSYNDSESTTITATVSHPFSNNQAITFTAIDKNENIIDTYTTITDNNGTATYEYESRGIGDVTIEAECMSLQETYEVWDYYYYDSQTVDKSRYSVTTGSANISYSNDGVTISGAVARDTLVKNTALTLPTNYMAEITLTNLNGESIPSKGLAYGGLCFDNLLIDMYTTQIDLYLLNSLSSLSTINTGVSNGDVIKIEMNNGTMKVYINNVLKATETVNNTGVFQNRTFKNGNGPARSITSKDLKVLEL